MRILILTLCLFFSISSYATDCDTKAPRFSVADLNSILVNLKRDLPIRERAERKSLVRKAKDSLLCDMDKSANSDANDRTRILTVDIVVMLTDLETVECKNQENVIRSGDANPTQEKQQKLSTMAKWSLELSKSFCSK